MNAQEFVALFKGYWPQARNVSAPKQSELWQDTIHGIPDDVVAYSLKRYARQNDYPPTVIKFEKFLWPFMDAWAMKNPQDYQSSQWNRRMKSMRDSEWVEDPAESKRQDCPGCEKSIRYGYLHDNDPFPEGGMVYREIEGTWYAARCPICSGPGHLRPVKSYGGLAAPAALPVPDRDAWEAGMWVPLSKTPGGPMWEALCEKRAYTQEHPEFVQFFAWERLTRASTKRKVLETLAQRQDEWAAENPGDAAALEKKIHDREVAKRKQREADQAEAAFHVEQDSAVSVAEREPGADEHIDAELELLESDQVLEFEDDPGADADLPF